MEGLQQQTMQQQRSKEGESITMILGPQHGRVATTNHAAAMKQRGRKYHYDIGSTTWKGCNNKPCSSNEAKREKVSL